MRNLSSMVSAEAVEYGRIPAKNDRVPKRTKRLKYLSLIAASPLIPFVISSLAQNIRAKDQPLEAEVLS